MKSIMFLLAAIAALAACNTTPVERITYARGPCLGTCPVYSVTVFSVGRGVFRGEQHTAVIGTRNFQVTPAQFDRFVAHLAPVRPRTGTVSFNSPAHCTSFFLDADSATVTWRGTDGQQQQLIYSYGCRFAGSDALAKRLTDAPTLLPIDAFIH